MTQHMTIANARLDQEILVFEPSVRSVRKADSIGKPWSEDKNTKVLERLKSARVEPHLLQVEVRDTVSQINSVSAEAITCVGLTKDESGHKLAFSVDREEFVLIQRTIHGKWQTMNIWGDAFGCYAAM
jgi:hypothetical protein